MRRAIAVGLLVAGLVTGWIGALSAAAQEPAHNLKSVHEKLEADKKAIVTQYMNLTEAEGKAFWPVYDQYQSELGKLSERTRSLLSSYAADYRSLTDEKAQKLLDDWIAIDQDEARQRAAAAKAGARGAPAQEGRALPADRERVPRAAPVRPRRHRSAGEVAHRRTE